MLGGALVGHEQLAHHQGGPGHADDIGQIADEAQGGRRVRHRADEEGDGEQEERAEVVERSQGDEELLDEGHGASVVKWARGAPGTERRKSKAPRAGSP